MARRTKKLNIAIATETRAEYGLLRPIYRALNAAPALVPTFLVSGMHHLKRFGRTADAIAADGVRFRAIKTATDGDEDSPGQRGAAIGKAVAGYAAALVDFDWLIVLGDRVEMLAAAVAATALGKPIAHIHGGDVAPGARDDAVRHAITKLAHLHFPATRDAAARIRRLGEQPWRIRLAGAPAIDAIRQMKLPGKAELDRLVGFDADKPFALVLQHAAGFAPQQERTYLRGTLEAVARKFERWVVIGPGLDAGSSKLHKTIEAFLRNRKPRDCHPWAFFKSVEQHEYFALLSRAAVLVGNSSSGMIESAWFKVPVVNIGPRQQGRLRSCNVVDCDYGRSEVERAIDRVMNDRGFRRRLARCRNLYGAGRAGETIARTLAATRIDRRLLVKMIGY
ncbi:MAG: UDP-N-acetylglucosamine 2-epimerase [Phycisphaerae bacterium]|nr:UDP-N-acetylglucosamine 2-epimerase [Phycisphaerae bacterium]